MAVLHHCSAQELVHSRSRSQRYLHAFALKAVAALAVLQRSSAGCTLRASWLRLPDPDAAASFASAVCCRLCLACSYTLACDACQHKSASRAPCGPRLSLPGASVSQMWAVSNVNDNARAAPCEPRLTNCLVQALQLSVQQASAWPAVTFLSSLAFSTHAAFKQTQGLTSELWADQARIHLECLPCQTAAQASWVLHSWL